MQDPNLDMIADLICKMTECVIQFHKDYPEVHSKSLVEFTAIALTSVLGRALAYQECLSPKHIELSADFKHKIIESIEVSFKEHKKQYEDKERENLN